MVPSMKRTRPDSDAGPCGLTHTPKRRRRSLLASLAAPTAPTAPTAPNAAAMLAALPAPTVPTAPNTAAVMGWLGAVPPRASADDVGPTPQDHEEWNDARRQRKLATRKRSVSPTKKPPEYRTIFLSEAGVFIDCEFAPPPAAPNLESLAIPPELQALVDRIAEEYCEECRVSARKGQGEGDWRAGASVTVMNKLQRYARFSKVLNVNGSDRPWRTDLKPVRATANIQRPVMPPPFAISPMPVGPKHLTASPDQPNSFSSGAGVILNPPFDNPPARSEPLDGDTLSYTSGRSSLSDPHSLSTPKPDICVGLEHRCFSPLQQSTLNALDTDPHAQTMGLHFPFLIFEAKGNAGLLGAQNQAAVGAACMLRILDLVHCADMVVWSVTTEGPIHELWVHYCDAEGDYQSINVGAWRVTSLEGAKVFVSVVARIMVWGSTVYIRRVLEALAALS